MKHYLLLIIGIVGFTACNQKERRLSESYLGIADYLKEANIMDSEIIFFYVKQPRMPLPNINCFDSNGIQLNTPPKCFQNIDNYIRWLNDSLVTIKSHGEAIREYLNSAPIINAFDEPVAAESLSKRDYYLFVDFIAIPDTSLMHTLYKAKEAVAHSKKKIKIFLVHAISEKNKKFLAIPNRRDPG